MRETSSPLLVEIDGYRNVTDLLTRRAAEAPEHAAFDVQTHPDDPAVWHPVTTAAYLDAVRLLAKGLMAIGVGAGDAVAIMAPTRYEWAVADLAIWFAGGVVVPVYDTSSAVQVTAVAQDAAFVAAIGGNALQVSLLRDACAATQTGVLGVWSMDADAGADGTLADLSARASRTSDDLLEERRRTASPDSPATIVYTSGTTGEPKGAILTHRNFLGQVLNIASSYRDVVRSDGNTIIFLPLAHVLARGLQLICLANGMRIAHVSTPSTVVPTLAVLRPTFLVVVPRVLQKIHGAAAQKAADMHLTPVWRHAETTAIQWGKSEEDHDDNPSATASRGLMLRRALFDRLFYARLRAVMGGRVGYILSGGAALDADLSLFFRGIGAPVIEGYGLTETTAPLTGNVPRSIRSGTVGRPLPGTTVRISDEGEILARGIGVFSGYRSASQTADAFVDGFFRTGDLGSLDDAGRLTLRGRLKDVIVTSQGKTIVPTVWENAAEKHPLIAHAVMVGENRPYLSALLMLDPIELAAWADAQDVDLPHAAALRPLDDGRLRAEVAGFVDEVNALVARSEQVRRFTLIVADPDDTTLVTPTMKIKRNVVLRRGADTVDALYR